MTLYMEVRAKGSMNRLGPWPQRLSFQLDEHVQIWDCSGMTLYNLFRKLHEVFALDVKISSVNVSDGSLNMVNGIRRKPGESIYNRHVYFQSVGGILQITCP